MLFRFLILVHFCAAFPLKCPEPAQWSIRARSHCPDPSKYFCLKNDLINGYSENCTIFDFLQPGRKNVLRGGLDADICSSQRYEPWPIKFFTNVSTNCIFQKSACHEEGQVVFDNGNRSTDANCRCDYTRGYDFIVKPRNPCFCVPSEEDCSCYLRMCHVLSPEEYRTEVIVAIFVTSILSLVICVSFQIQIQITKSLDVTNRNEHLAAIKDGTEIRRYVRIQVIGKDGVGKSSLVRRLVGDSNMKVNSTDGIDIVKKCQIRTTDGEWIIGKVETERNKIINRIQEAIYKEPKQSELVSDQVIPYEGEKNRKEEISSKEPLSKVERKQENYHPTVSMDNSLKHENEINIMDTITPVAEKSSINKLVKDNVVLSTNDIKKSADSIKIDDMRKKIFEQMDEILSEVKKDQDRMTSESLVECGLWDFAGQKDYYATHQTFLNPHAIYILVTNISEDIAATEDETDFDAIEEYIDFWFDSIHCLSTSSSEEKPNIPKGYSKHRLYPPVIVVCTHIDKYKTHKEVEKRKTEYIEKFEEIVGGQYKANHNRGIYFISNTEFLESDCKKLKDKIYEVAKETIFFEEQLPRQWIQLENALSVLKHESKQNILSWQTIVELAQITFIEEEELLPFLTYQHKIGNIIFFEDIKEYIIVQPDWLVKCFRCLVCDNHPNKRNYEIVESTDWKNLKKTGQLSDNIIDRLFEKEPDLEFKKYKTHILNVMEKFDILVKPTFIDTNNDSSLIPNSYYMPCMITQQSTSLDIIQKMFEGEKCKFSFSPWLIFEFKFLPLAYFNHILFYYITKYTVCEEKKGRKTLYRGKALVNLDKTKLRKLCVCFSKNAIALQIWKLADVDDKIYSTILEELCRKIADLKKKLRQSISYDIKAKCRNGDYSNKQGRITYKELGEICEQGRYWCPEHNDMHSKDDVEKTWLQHADIVEKISDEISTREDELIPNIEPNKEEEIAQDQALVKANLPVSVILRQQFNIQKSKNEYLTILSCIKIDNTLVFTDYRNERLIICNSDGTDIHHIPLYYQPYFMTEVNFNTVAVSCGRHRTILIINISTRSVTSTINTSGNCYGISYNDNKLYVVIDYSKMHVMDLTGKVIRTIPLPSGSIRDITVDRDRLVCTDVTSIYCCSLDGKLIWKFKMDKLQDLRRVTTDDEGSVYVTNDLTNTAVVVSDDGKHHRELLTESDGLKNPNGIYFDKKENILLVCNIRDGNVFLFDLKMKPT
ncbi:uncharacterized protein LOC127732394 isoform X2 [Mytilus californianus]|uniref:uncharacterized protein LOC127732394 isoform X2 n=1 Tax=Mytilus californianus TaxID=6549 RepID=UPI002246CCF1|nr:uncharacterized protein LOC127732394 isoform X2 [Mytilus californianus]